MLAKVKALVDAQDVEIWLNSKLTDIYFDLTENKVVCKIGDKRVMSNTLALGHGARLPVLNSSRGTLELVEKLHPRPAYHLLVEDNSCANVLEVIMESDPLIKYVHDVTRFTTIGDRLEDSRKVFVFALQHDVEAHEELREKLFVKLKHLKLIGKNAKVITSLYSEVFLPTIYDEDLYELKNHFGDLVNILRTENFTRGVGYYVDRWKADG